MVYNRGNRRNFDDWENVYGCRGWSYNNILPYFLRSENETDSTYLANGYHNTSGPITVTSNWNNLENELPIFKDYIQTAQMAGYRIIDPNGECLLLQKNRANNFMIFFVGSFHSKVHLKME